MIEKKEGKEGEEEEEEEEIYVQGLMPDSPAIKAGAKNGDVIFSANGMRIKSFDDYVAAKESRKDGMDLVLIRNKTEMIEVSMEFDDE